MLCPGLSMHTCAPSQPYALLYSGQLLLKMLYTPYLWPGLAPYPACSSTQTEGGKGLHLETECASKRFGTFVAVWKEKFEVSNSLTYTEGTTYSCRALVICISCCWYLLQTTDPLIFCLLQIIISFCIQPLSLPLAYNNNSRIMSNSQNSVNYKLQCGSSTHVHQCQLSPFSYFAFLVFLRDCLPPLQAHSQEDWEI